MDIILINLLILVNELVSIQVLWREYYKFPMLKMNK